MYCKNCGCKIPAGTVKCPDCGEDTGDIEYCGGFWGITELAAKCGQASSSGETNSYKSVIAAEFPETHEEAETNEYFEKTGNIERVGKSENIRSAGRSRKSENKKNGLLLKMVSAAAVVILIFGLVQTVRLSMLKKEYENYQEKSKTEYNSLNQQLESLNDDYTSLQSQYQEQNEQYENLSQEYETLKPTYSEEDVNYEKTNASQKQGLEEKTEEPASEVQTENAAKSSGRGPAGNGR